MGELELKLAHELRPGSLVVSNRFRLPARTPEPGAAGLVPVSEEWVEVDRDSLDAWDGPSAVHVYRVSEPRDREIYPAAGGIEKNRMVSSRASEYM
eukprot:5739200-Prymnesium_polylepis.1